MSQHHLTRFGTSYLLPHRIHSAHVYPVTAPNGSTLIIYGHERGLRVLWRGGRRRRESRATRTNGTWSDTIDLTGGGDDEDDNSATAVQQRQAPDDRFEAAEEEQDADCPFAAIIQHLDIDLGTADKPKGALRVAVPTINPTAVPVKLLRTTAIVAVACADGKVVVLSIPLLPPADAETDQALTEIAQSTIKLQETGPVPADIAVKYLPSEQQPLAARHEEDVDGHLLIASVSRALHVWSVEVTGDIILAISHDKLLRRAALPAVGMRVSFHPSNRHAQLLVTDVSGTARIYDPHGSDTPYRRPGSSDSMLSNPVTPSITGKWLMTYHAPYCSDQETQQISAAFARRKSILAAKWALSGNAILVLLENGEWGLWDLATQSPGKRAEEFALRGFLDTASHTEVAEPLKQKKGMSKLAPMTPNTRKTKAEQLFTGAPKTPGVAPRGGISITAKNTRTGPVDESVVLWYNHDIYSINSLQSFYQRSCSNSGAGGLGSLYSPGLTHITDIKLHNEEVTSISQFSSSTTGVANGQMNTPRDLLISTERHAIIVQSLPSKPSKNLFQQKLTERPAAVDRDQHMLDAGNLDLNGMDRLLDSMAGGNPAALPRRVGFAAELG
jgi:hypothetical protein